MPGWDKSQHWFPRGKVWEGYPGLLAGKGLALLHGRLFLWRGGMPALLARVPAPCSPLLPSHGVSERLTRPSESPCFLWLVCGLVTFNLTTTQPWGAAAAAFPLPSSAGWARVTRSPLFSASTKRSCCSLARRPEPPCISTGGATPLPSSRPGPCSLLLVLALELRLQAKALWLGNGL